jgi:hypothetical protein
MTASWFGSLDLPHTRLRRDSTAPESALASDCHPDRTTVLEAARMRPGEIEPRTRRWKKGVTLLDSKGPYKGLYADSVEKHEPASDVATVMVDSLKALDPNRLEKRTWAICSIWAGKISPASAITPAWSGGAWRGGAFFPSFIP